MFFSNKDLLRTKSQAPASMQEAFSEREKRGGRRRHPPGPMTGRATIIATLGGSGLYV
jgi:hypothetical protein